MMAGADTMGTSMAQTSAVHGYDAVLYNHREVVFQKACYIVELNQEALVLSGGLSQAESGVIRTRIQLTSDESCFQGCSIIVESIVRDI